MQYTCPVKCIRDGKGYAGYDITQKKAEMELQERETFLPSLIYNIPLEFYVIDIDGKNVHAKRTIYSKMEKYV